MKRLWGFAGVLAMLAVIGVVVPSSAQDNPSIKEIMTKAHKGGDALLAKIGKGLNAKEPDWTDLGKMSKELADLGTALGKNKPAKGEQASWDKLTKMYQDNAKTLVAAVDKKEQKDALAAQKKLAGSCMECHKAHKGK
jgi:hypothetical protein